MKPPRIITIFGSSQLEENYVEYQKAILLGRMLAQAGFTVCNGGYGGIMEASARGAKDGGGETIGIITQEFHRKPNRWTDDVRSTKTWRDRLFQLIETGDAYVLFDGGTGTLVEWMMAWEMTNKKMIKKPIIVFGSFLRRLLFLFGKQHFVVMNDSVKQAKTVQDVMNYLHEAF